MWSTTIFSPSSQIIRLTTSYISPINSFIMEGIGFNEEGFLLKNGSVVTDPFNHPISADDDRLSDEYLASLNNFKVGDVVIINDPDDSYNSKQALIIDKTGFTVWLIAKPIFENHEIFFNKQTFKNYSAISVDLNNKRFCCFKYEDNYFYDKFIILQRPPTVLQYFDQKKQTSLFYSTILDGTVIAIEEEDEFYSRISKLGVLGKLSPTIDPSENERIHTDIVIDLVDERTMAILEIDFDVSDKIEEIGPVKRKVGRPKKEIQPAAPEDNQPYSSLQSKMPKIRSPSRQSSVYLDEQHDNDFFPKESFPSDLESKVPPDPFQDDDNTPEVRHGLGETEDNIDCNDEEEEEEEDDKDNDEILDDDSADTEEILNEITNDQPPPNQDENPTDQPDNFAILQKKEFKSIASAKTSIARANRGYTIKQDRVVTSNLYRFFALIVNTK